MNAGALAVFVRIALYVVTGWLAGAWLDPETVDVIRHPETVAVVTGAVAAAWYGAAKFFGWRT